MFQIGRSKPGKIVTNADGVNTPSNHQVKKDGFGHACDSCFLIDGKAVWEVPDAWWTAFGALCTAVGLRWGIHIGDTIDRPHAELPQNF